MDDTPSQATSSRPGLARDPSSHGGGRPRGILKHLNAEGTSQADAGVRWDEVNLNLNEVEKEATTRMQINEPKTPYVRYNAETDEVMDLDKIPGFELGQTEQNNQAGETTGDHDMHEGTSTSGASASDSHSERPSSNRAPSASSRSSSFSGSRRGSETSRRGSDVSERKMVVVEDLGPGADAEDEGADEETRQAKKEFKMRRGSHYSGEGEVMKRFRAGIVDLDDEDDDNDSAIDIDDEEAQADTTTEGVNGSNGQGVNGQSRSSGRRQGGKVPPVPPLPNGTS